MQEEKWQNLETKRVLEHPFLTVTTMTNVRLPDGRVIEDWPIVAMRDYISVLALDADGQAIVVEGYKHGAGRSSWQVVGGYIEPGEEPLLTAQRELREETGYESGDWQLLGSFVVDLNRYGGTGHLFLASNTRQVSMPTDDDLEQQTVRWVAVSELADSLRDGRVVGMAHAATIGLALLAWIVVDLTSVFPAH